MPRFFVAPDQINDGQVKISGDDAFHIARSLRMAVGDTVTVADGSADEYLCKLVMIRDSECICTVVSKNLTRSEPQHSITLYMAYPKGDKMETVVQKSVELGASCIVPFESERCIKRPGAEKADKLLIRLNRIAEEAAKQCGRGKLPRVKSILKFNEMTEAIKAHSLVLFCYEGECAVSLKQVLSEKGSSATDIGIIIGSEGGFSPSEAKAITDTGADCVNLGPRILRCETAPDYVLSAISYEFELK